MKSKSICLLLTITVSLLTSCSHEEKVQEKNKVYATAQLDVASLSQSYSKRIDEILKNRKDSLPDEVRDALLNIQAFLQGEDFNPYRALEGVRTIEEYQKKYKTHFFSERTLTELKRLIKQKAQYARPIIG